MEYKGVFWHNAQGMWKTVWRCKNTKCTGRDVVVRAGYGYSNTASHLQANTCMGIEAFNEQLMAVKSKTDDTKQQKRMADYITILAERDKAITEIMKWMLTKDMPIAPCDDKIRRKFSKYGQFFPTSRRIPIYLGNLTEIVEKKLMLNFQTSLDSFMDTLPCHLCCILSKPGYANKVVVYLTLVWQY
jgi:hypothetical protein